MFKLLDGLFLRKKLATEQCQPMLVDSDKKGGMGEGVINNWS